MLPIVVFSEVRLIRDALAETLAGAGLDVVASTGAVAEVVARLRSGGSCVVVVEVPGPRGWVTVDQLARRSPSAELVVVGAGAAACGPPAPFTVKDVAAVVPLDSPLESFVEAVGKVANGGDGRGAERPLGPTSGSSADRKGVSVPSAALTPRERDVLGLLHQGLSNKEIARRLAIRPATVKNHVHSILTKLNVGRRGEAVAVVAIDR